MRRMQNLFVALVLMLSLAANAAQRQCVVLEHFTNTSCGPCFVNNPALEAAVNQMGRDTCVKVSYHVNWHGPNDEFYLYNSAENQQRWQWYNVTGVPDLVIGNVNPAYPFSTTNIKTLVRSEFAENCPCSFQDVVALQSSPTQIHFQGILDAESAMTNVKLFAALITTNVDPYNAPNGEDHISEPFRDHGYHATQGIVVTATPGTPQSFEGNLTMNANWDRANLELVVWAQNTSTKEIVQGFVTSISSEYAFTTTNENPAQAIIATNGGEQGYLVQLDNIGTMNDTYTVTLECDWPQGWSYSVEENGGASNPSTISVALESGQSTFLVVRANPNGHAGSAAFTLNIQSDNNELISSATTWRLMSGLDVLVIDADGGDTYETYYAAALDAADENINVVWGWWDTSLDEVDITLFDGVDAVVWFTGDLWQETLSPIDQLNVQDYLDAGGNLFITGQGLGFDMRNDQFFTDYLHASYLRNFPIGSSVTGVDGTLFGDQAFAIVSGTGANNQNRQSSLQPLDAGSTLIFSYDQQYQGATQGAGLLVQNDTYKIVYLGFGFEAIATEAARNTMMERAIGWLLGVSATPGTPEVLPTEFSLAQNYPNPFNPETTIPFALPTRANVKLSVYDLLGREVATLVNGTMEAGSHTVNWNASDLSSGVYFYRLDAQAGEASFNSTRKVVLMK